MGRTFTNRCRTWARAQHNCLYSNNKSSIKARDNCKTFKPKMEQLKTIKSRASQTLSLIFQRESLMTLRCWAIAFTIIKMQKPS